jgi:hypothetical protein
MILKNLIDEKMERYISRDEPLSRGERVGVRAQDAKGFIEPPHPLAMLTTSPRRGEVKKET